MHRHDKRYVRQKRLIQHQVASILREAEQDAPPVDLVALAKIRRIHRIDLRPMLLEGCIDVIPGGFKVLIQHPTFQSFNLEDETALNHLKPRQRFSLAHEIAHTFFYDLSSHQPVLSETLPGLPVLESLCQYGASQMLLPEGLLLKQLKKDEPLTYQLTVNLASRFKVSPEAVIRRLDELDRGMTPYRGLILACMDDSGVNAEIRAACYHPSLLPCLPKPKLYSDLRDWCGGITDEEIWQLSAWDQCVKLRGGDLHIKKRSLSRQKNFFFLEVQFVPFS